MIPVTSYCALNIFSTILIPKESFWAFLRRSNHVPQREKQLSPLGCLGWCLVAPLALLDGLFNECFSQQVRRLLRIIKHFFKEDSMISRDQQAMIKNMARFWRIVAAPVVAIFDFLLECDRSLRAPSPRDRVLEALFLDDIGGDVKRATVLIAAMFFLALAAVWP
jgi:hypothetical protein